MAATTCNGSPDLPAVIVLATGNPHKAAEIRAIVAPLLPSTGDLVGLADFDSDGPPDEIERHRTFGGNARAKALWCRDRLGLACLAEDSGLCVDALNGRPGVRSARWAGPGDAERNRRLLAELHCAGAESAERRTARFVCACAYAPASNAPAIVSIGRVEGTIVASAEGDSGFGYDPLFYCTEIGSTFAQADAARKNAVSHRARAIMQLLSQFRTGMP